MSLRHGLTFTSRRPQVQRNVKSALTTAGNKIGLDLQGKAKRLTPVDTGRLRASIAQAVNEIDQGNTIRVTVGTNVQYAWPVHERHPTHAKYLETPARENAGRYANIVRDELRKLQ